MAIDVARERPVIMVTPDDETVRELTVSMQKQLGEKAAGRDLAAMVRAALDELAPVTVRNYLPLLVERSIRRQLG